MLESVGVVTGQAWFHSLELEMMPNNISVTVACPGPVFSNITTVAFTGKSGQVQSDVLIVARGDCSTNELLVESSADTSLIHHC